jgi:hypothetical protein
MILTRILILSCLRPYLIADGQRRRLQPSTTPMFSALLS